MEGERLISLKNRHYCCENIKLLFIYEKAMSVKGFYKFPAKPIFVTVEMIFTLTSMFQKKYTDTVTLWNFDDKSVLPYFL